MGPLQAGGQASFGLSGNSANIRTSVLGTGPRPRPTCSVWPVVVCCLPPAPATPDAAAAPRTRAGGAAAWAAWRHGRAWADAGGRHGPGDHGRQACRCRRVGPGGHPGGGRPSPRRYTTVGWTAAAPQAGAGDDHARHARHGRGRHATPPASVRRATASSPSSCRNRRPSSGRRQRGRTKSTRSEIRTRGTGYRKWFWISQVTSGGQLRTHLHRCRARDRCMAAATAYANLAAELSTTATQWESIISHADHRAVDGWRVGGGGGRGPADRDLPDRHGDGSRAGRPPRPRRRRPPMRRRSRGSCPRR